MTRRVAVVTGSRADYGILKSVLQAISEHQLLSLQVLVTGMHLLRRFGHTVDDVLRDGWSVAARIPMQRGDDDPADQARGLAKGIDGISKYLVRARSDVVLVLGDRIEAMAGALAGVATGKFVAHVHGGDVAPGDLDGCLRDAITKLAHLHFPATDASAARIIGMGESRRRVHCVGPPGLDRLFELARSNRRTHRSRHRDQNRPALALVVFHPSGRAAARERAAMRNLLNAVRDIGLSRIILYPNTDRGHSGIIDAILEHRREDANGAVRVVHSMPRDVYLDLLMNCQVLVGNSSSGLIEAGAAGTPAVNVGDRQKGREKLGKGVVDVKESYEAIRAGLCRAIRPEVQKRSAVLKARGNAGTRIAQILAKTALVESLRKK